MQKEAKMRRLLATFLILMGTPAGASDDVWDQQWGLAAGGSGGASGTAGSGYSLFGLTYAHALFWGFDARLGAYIMGSLDKSGSDKSPFVRGGNLDLELLWSPRAMTPFIYPYAGIGGRALSSNLGLDVTQAFGSGHVLGGLNLFGFFYLEGRMGVIKAPNDPTRNLEFRGGLTIPLGIDW